MTRTTATSEEIMNLQMGGKDVVKYKQQDFLLTRTYDHTANEHLWEVQAHSVPSTLAAMEWLSQQGYELCMHLNNRYPIKMYQGCTFFVTREDAAFPEAKQDTQEEVPQEAPEEASTEGDEEEKAVEQVEDKSSQKASQASTEELLEGPNWTKAKTMSKKDLEDYADKFRVDLDTSNTKGEMLESFQAQWQEKLSS